MEESFPQQVRKVVHTQAIQKNKKKRESRNLLSHYSEISSVNITIYFHLDFFLFLYQFHTDTVPCQSAQTYPTVRNPLQYSNPGTSKLHLPNQTLLDFYLLSNFPLLGAGGKFVSKAKSMPHRTHMHERMVKHHINTSHFYLWYK